MAKITVYHGGYTPVQTPEIRIGRDNVMSEYSGRENKKDNDLFFTCSLIDYIARKTKNTRVDIVDALGQKRIEKIYDLADMP